MGTHPNGLKTFDWSRKDCEIWMFNEAPNFKKDNGKLLYPKCDVVFQMHHEAIWKNPKNRSDEGHYKWLKSGKTPDVYMQKKYPEIPKSIKYPIKSVTSLSDNVRMVIDGKKQRITNFSSSPDYAFALVVDQWKKGKRYKQVEIHGIELAMVSEYQYQRTGFGFWIGYLTALGVKVLLFNSIFNTPMYGYEGDVIIPSKEFERRITNLEAQLDDNRDAYNQDAREFLEGLHELLEKDITKEVELKLNELARRGEHAGIINGRIKENQRYIEKAIAMEKVAGTSVFSVGDFDGPRVSLSKQLGQVQIEAVNLNAKINSQLSELLKFKKGTKKRQKSVDEFGTEVATLLNKNMLLFHVSGAIQENQYYIDSIKQSYQAVKQDI